MVEPSNGMVPLNNSLVVSSIKSVVVTRMDTVVALSMAHKVTLWYPHVNKNSMIKMPPELQVENGIKRLAIEYRII